MTTIANRNGILVHPLTLFVSVWVLSFALYAMRLSELLVVEVKDVARVIAWIVVPFAIVNLAFGLTYILSPKSRSRVRRVDINDQAYLQRVEKQINVWFKYWVLLSLLEILFSRGVPIVWLITHSSRKYNEFGLPVVHVFVTSLLSVIGLAKLGLYLLRGDRRRLLIPLFLLVWSVIIVSRGFMITTLIQWAVLWFCLKGSTFKAFSRSVLISCLVILLFGYLGDFRTGLSSFRDLARPTRNYPEWLPSGVLWFYVYITSPITNLTNTSLSTRPSYDILFPRTTYYLFPTVVRNAIYGKDSTLEQGADLVESSLNVSSAYIGPFLDYGYSGIACFSALLGLIAGYLWQKRTVFRDQLLYSIIAQCLLLSIFWNYLFYNPFVGQVFWIYYLFRPKTLRLLPKLIPETPSSQATG